MGVCSESTWGLTSMEMGMSSHFYLANPKGTTHPVDASQCPPEDGVNYAGITPLELSTLWAIIERAEWDVKMMRLFSIVATTNVGDRIIHQIPAPFVERFARLSAEEIAQFAEAWSTTVEMSL